MAAASPNGSSISPRSERQNSFMSATCFELEEIQGARLLRLISADGTNRLTREVVLALTQAISELATAARPLVIAGNRISNSALKCEKYRKRSATCRSPTDKQIVESLSVGGPSPDLFRNIYLRIPDPTNVRSR